MFEKTTCNFLLKGYNSEFDTLTFRDGYYNFPRQKTMTQTLEGANY